MPVRRGARAAAEAAAAEAVREFESAPPPVPAEPLPEAGLTAAASRVEIVGHTRRRKMQAPWQERAWHFYNVEGVLQSAAGWMSNSLSRVRLFAAELGPDGRPSRPATDPRVLAVAAGLFGGVDGTTQAMGQLGVHLTVPGDSYVICEANEETRKDDWYVVSTTELKARSGVLGVDRGDGWRALDPESSVVIRVWLPHPQKREEATSMARAALPILEELEGLNKRQAAMIDSRLASAGLLLISKDIEFQAPGKAAGSGVGAFSKALVDTAMTAIDDRESAAALVPVVAAVPAEAVDKVKLIKFWEGLTAETKENRADCIQRFAVTADMQPEALLGTGDVNHWGTQAITEEGVKIHVSPKAQTICQAVTEQYFRPALEEWDDLDPNQYAIWYDTSELLLRPNRVADAKDLHGAGVLADKVLVIEAGFDPETDMPSADEKREKLLTQIVLARPDLITPEILTAIGLGGIEIVAPAAQPALPAAPAEEEDDDTVDPDSTTPSTAEDPAPSAGLHTAQVVAVQTLVSRGLERANFRLLTRGNRGRFAHVTDSRQLYLQPELEITGADVDRAMEGAFPYLEEVAIDVALPVRELAAELDGYVRDLLTQRIPHTRDASVALVGRITQ